MKRILQKKLLICLTMLAVSIVVIFIIFLIFIDSISTTFNITANTERISVTTLDENGSLLNLYDVDIYDNRPNPIFRKFNGSFRINKKTSVTIERIAFGSAVLTFNASEGQAAGTLLNENGSFVKHSGRYLQIFINNIKAKADSGQTIILPIDGIVSLGRSVDFETFDGSTAVLRNGLINMTGHSNFSESFDAGTSQLFLGDQIIFDDQNNKAFGFITINESSGMQAAYRVIAKQAIILKPGPKEKKSGVVIQASKLDRLLKASFFQSISLFFGIMVVFITIVAFLKDIKEYKELIRTLLK